MILGATIENFINWAGRDCSESVPFFRLRQKSSSPLQQPSRLVCIYIYIYTCLYLCIYIYIYVCVCNTFLSAYCRFGNIQIALKLGLYSPWRLQTCRAHHTKASICWLWICCRSTPLFFVRTWWCRLQWWLIPKVWGLSLQVKFLLPITSRLHDMYQH